MKLPENVRNFATEIARVSGVKAVVVGGSWAKGTARPDSDIDLAIYYDPETPPDLSALREVVNQFEDNPRDDILTNFGEWGPWINGGGWLSLQGQRVDLLYSDLQKVRFFVQETLEGRSILNHQPGHPHGFHSHMYAGQIHIAKILFDSEGEIKNLKTQLEPYPAKLKDSLTRDFLWQADFALQVAEKGAHRGDIFYVNGFLFDCAASLIQVLFALNETFWLNEKGAIEMIETFRIKPENVKSTVESVLGNTGRNANALEQSLQTFKALVDQTRELTTP